MSEGGGEGGREGEEEKGQRVRDHQQSSYNNWLVSFECAGFAIEIRFPHLNVTHHLTPISIGISSVSHYFDTSR